MSKKFTFSLSLLLLVTVVKAEDKKFFTLPFNIHNVIPSVFSPPPVLAPVASVTNILPVPVPVNIQNIVPNITNPTAVITRVVQTVTNPAVVIDSLPVDSLPVSLPVDTQNAVPNITDPLSVIAPVIAVVDSAITQGTSLPVISDVIPAVVGVVDTSLPILSDPTAIGLPSLPVGGLPSNTVIDSPQVIATQIVADPTSALTTVESIAPQVDNNISVPVVSDSIPVISTLPINPLDLQNIGNNVPTDSLPVALPVDPQTVIPQVPGADSVIAPAISLANPAIIQNVTNPAVVIGSLPVDSLPVSLPVDTQNIVPNITDPASVVTMVESAVSQPDSTISVPVVSDVVPAVDPSVITVIPDILPDPSMIAPGTAIDQMNMVLNLLQSMSQSFSNDVTVYQGVSQDLQILLSYFESNSEKRRGFINTIVNLFSGSQSTITQMQSSYDLLFAQYSQDMSQKDTQIQTLEDQIVTMQQEVEQEKNSMMDVIAQLTNSLSGLQSSYNLLSVVNGVNIGDLVQSLQQLSDIYNQMSQEREQFLSLLDELKDQLPL